MNKGRKGERKGRRSQNTEREGGREAENP